MTNLGAALGWKFNHAPGISTVGENITEWPVILGNEPEGTEITNILEEYDLHILLTDRLNDVSVLFKDKMNVGFTFNDPQGNPQVFEPGETGLLWLDRSALRARKSKDDVEGKTFNTRLADRVEMIMTDTQLINLASDLFDWGTSIDDVQQGHKTALNDIANGTGTNAQKIIDLNAYDITIGF